MEHDLKQAGKKQTFDTGAQRDTQEGKPRLDLISPVFLDRLGILLAKGAEHYGERNWEKGMPLSRVLASAMRHLNATLDGLEDEDHPIQCVFNLMAYVHILHRIRAGSLPVELDDLPREKNLEGDLTSDRKGSTIGRSWKVKKSWKIIQCCGIAYPEKDIADGYINCCRSCDKELTIDKKDSGSRALCPQCARSIPATKVSDDDSATGWKAYCILCNKVWAVVMEETP